MTTMRCPSCGEPVELGEDGVTFKHVVRANRQLSSMFHNETLVHQCDAEMARVSQGSAQERSERLGLRL
jgi:hypothetical protein